MKRTALQTCLGILGLRWVVHPQQFQHGIVEEKAAIRRPLSGVHIRGAFRKATILQQISLWGSRTWSSSKDFITLPRSDFWTPNASGELRPTGTEPGTVTQPALWAVSSTGLLGSWSYIQGPVVPYPTDFPACRLQLGSGSQ